MGWEIGDMEIEFTKGNVNFQTLLNEIEYGFVKSRGFEILKKEREKRMFSLTFNSSSIPGVVTVVVRDLNEKFLVSFHLKGNSRFLSVISYIGIPFGTGSLFLRNVKKLENFKKLEKEFYEFVSKRVAFLSSFKEKV